MFLWQPHPRLCRPLICRTIRARNPVGGTFTPLSVVFWPSYFSHKMTVFFPVFLSLPSAPPSPSGYSEAQRLPKIRLSPPKSF